MKKNTIPPILAVVWFVLGGHSARAQPEPTYWKDIRPIFRKNCIVCHSAKNLKEPDVSGGLALDSYEAVRKGSKRPILQQGKSAASLVIGLLETKDEKKRMPLETSPLSAQKIALIRRWIDSGAREGQKPADTPTTIITKKTAKTRKLDVILPTTTFPPAGTLAKTTGKLELSLRVGPLAPVTAVTFSPDNKLVASGAYGQVTVWDLATVQPSKVLTNVLGAVNDLRFSPDGKILAVAGGQPSAKGDLRLYQVSDWRLLAVLRGHDDVVFSVDFSRDGKLLASASFDKTVRIWNVARLKEERILTGHSDFVYAVAFSPDAKHVVSASKDRTVKMVETATGKSVFTLGGMDLDVLSVAYSPDGKHIVSSGFETALRWWNPQTGERARTVGGHGIAVNELAFSTDGSRLVSAGSDGTARVWNTTTGSQVRPFNVGSVVYAVAISPNNKRVATGSFDGLVRLWDEVSGRHLITFLSLPVDKDPNWLALAPAGYAHGSSQMGALGQWRVAGLEVPGDKAWPTLRQPAMLARALRGETLAPPKFSK